MLMSDDLYDEDELGQEGLEGESAIQTPEREENQDPDFQPAARSRRTRNEGIEVVPDKESEPEPEPRSSPRAYSTRKKAKKDN